ncbi:hypothetical protein OSB04_031908 [Centaurea solstitialis]|uniref:CCHC-type domain-containing protein n=1 Tax=Centaurea solstitialis TaxID=347529 RepID=A0AA38SAG2_9ASTR|nr:hypothetical protein OSB04_031908 [Centaurea solstitialis]
MSRDLLSMGSKSKPPVLQIGEYPQWHVRMIQFLNNIDKTLMVSIQEGPIKPFIDIPGTPETATTPAIEPRRVYKLFRHYNELEKIRAELDDKALTFLTMAIPNDLFNRVDSRNTAKELWDELEKQFQGTERSIQAKLNQAIGAYEGFKALEGETLADSYSRFNIIMNDLRRNGMNKSTSEINYKFLKNLNPEWDHYSVNLQMNKNLAEEDLHDLYSILSQHEVKVKHIVMKQKSISDSLALLTEKSKSVLSSGSKKKSHSKALVTELSDSDSETVEDDSSESDVDLKRVADKLALLSSSIHKRYGKKKYKPKEYEKRPEKKTYDKGNPDEKGNVCFNCGKPGHFVKHCRAPKVRDFDYYSKKAQLAKRKSECKSVYDYESDSDSDETKPCFHSDNDDDIEKGFEEEKINFISNPMFESQETPSCFDQSIKPEVTELITYVVIDKDGYLVYKSLDSMVAGDILKSELKLPDVEFGAVFEKPKSGIQDDPNVVNVSSDSGISKDEKSSCTLLKSETCSINFDASTFEVGSTSCATLETSSKDSSDVCSVPKTPINSSSSDSTDLKSFKRHGLGWKKKDSKKKKHFATNESFVKKSSFDDANKCNLNVRFNKCQNSFEDVKKKRSSGVSHDKSRAYSFDHHAKVFSAKKKNLSKAKDKSVDVKFVCKWIPKDLLNAQISKSGINCKILGSSSDLLKMYETNKK